MSYFLCLFGASVAESLGLWGPHQSSPCGWDAPLCNSGTVRLGIVEQEDREVREDQNHPEIPVCPPTVKSSPEQGLTFCVQPQN
jgi:hypothetical protein